MGAQTVYFRKDQQDVEEICAKWKDQDRLAEHVCAAIRDYTGNKNADFQVARLKTELKMWEEYQSGKQRTLSLFDNEPAKQGTPKQKKEAPTPTHVQDTVDDDDIVKLSKPKKTYNELYAMWKAAGRGHKCWTEEQNEEWLIQFGPVVVEEVLPRLKAMTKADKDKPILPFEDKKSQVRGDPADSFKAFSKKQVKDSIPPVTYGELYQQYKKTGYNNDNLTWIQDHGMNINVSHVSTLLMRMKVWEEQVEAGSTDG